MELKEIAGGAGAGGFLGALFTWLGIKSQIDKLQNGKVDKGVFEAEITNIKDDIKEIKVTTKETHDAVIEMRANMHKRNGDG